MAKALEDLTPEIIEALKAGDRPSQILAKFPVSRTSLWRIRRLNNVANQSQQQTAA